MKVEKIVAYIREISDRIRAEMQSIPRTINPQNVVESIEVSLKFINSIIRTKSAIKIIEATEKFEIPQRDKIQIQYYKEVLKEYLVSLYNSCSRILDTFKNTFPDDSFERLIFVELEKDLKESASLYLKPELIESKKEEGKT